MHIDFDRDNVGDILRAMLLQAGDQDWEVLREQHAKCAPIVRRFGGPEHLEGLIALESRMQQRRFAD